jgi:HEPN domain-containing protein
MDEKTVGIFSIWVQHSYRDLADKDYLAARILNKHELYQVSAWSSLQALEKYLKGVLLFSFHSTKEYRHDLNRLWKAVEMLPILKAEIPSDCIDFLEYLTTQGANRYLDYPLSFQGDEFFRLDRCVWHVRKYCQDFFLLPGISPEYSTESKSLISQIPKEATPQAIKSFRIPGGYLESILDDMNNPLRKILVWKNSYYGKYKKDHIRYLASMSWERPVYMIFPELLTYVEQVAYIPESTMRELQKYCKERLLEKIS